MMNAVCTIVAKNYLSQAKTLGDSIKNSNPNIDFYILLVDESDGDIDYNSEKYNIIEAKDIGIDDFEEMAFKYNVLEFCTAVKPFFLEYLFNLNKYSKIIYFDPDIYVYNNLDCIFKELDDNFIILTPHYVNMELKYNGAFSDEELLFVGIYNLGFIALKYTDEAKKIIEWWKIRLKDKCYADRMDALHVDQKWMDFIPSFFNDGVLISKNTGYNAAIWNIQEKELFVNEGKYHVKNNFDKKVYPLTFFHFSGFDPNNINQMCKKQKKYTLDNRPEFKQLFSEYAKNLIDNGYNELNKLSYTYSKFKNGIVINQLYRRIYRVILEKDINPVTDSFMYDLILNIKHDIEKNNYDIKQPFSTEDKSYYSYLKNSNLIIKDGQELYNLNKRTYSNLDKKIKLCVTALKFCKKVLGTKKYFLLITFLSKYTRTEYQMFLLK